MSSIETCFAYVKKTKKKKKKRQGLKLLRRCKLNQPFQTESKLLKHQGLNNGITSGLHSSLTKTMTKKNLKSYFQYILAKKDALKLLRSLIAVNIL